MAADDQLRVRRIEGQAWLVEISGEHDMSTAPMLAEQFESLFDDDSLIIVRHHRNDVPGLRGRPRLRERDTARGEVSHRPLRPSRRHRTEPRPPRPRRATTIDRRHTHLSLSRRRLGSAQLVRDGRAHRSIGQDAAAATRTWPRGRCSTSGAAPRPRSPGAAPVPHEESSGLSGLGGWQSGPVDDPTPPPSSWRCSRRARYGSGSVGSPWWWSTSTPQLGRRCRARPRRVFPQTTVDRVCGATANAAGVLGRVISTRPRARRG